MIFEVVLLGVDVVSFKLVENFEGDVELNLVFVVEKVELEISSSSLSVVS